MDFPAGSVFRHIMAVGGGYGDPLDRDPAAILNDISGERITAGIAQRAYGVVIDSDRMAVNETATAPLREQCRQARQRLHPPAAEIGPLPGKRGRADTRPGE